MIQEQIQTQAVPQTKSIPAKAYSVLEEWLNSISHGVGFIAAIVGLVFMLYRAEDTLALTTAAIYGSTLILVFLSSTLYHAISCLLYTSPSPRDRLLSRMPSSA